MAQFTITASNITTNSATIELTSEIAHTAASSVDVTVVSSNGVEAYAGTTTIPVGSIGDVISVPVTGLRSNMEYTVTAKTGTTYTDTGTFTTTDDPTARTATQSQWEDLADKVEAASVAQSTLYDTVYGSNTDGSPTQKAVQDALTDSTVAGKNIRIGTGLGTTGAYATSLCTDGSAVVGTSAVSIGGAFSGIIGAGAVRIGIGGASAGSQSIAVGHSANAGGTYGIAIGMQSTNTSSGNYGVAMGYQATSGPQCIAMGCQASSTTLNSIAIGHSAVTASGGQNNISIGYNAQTFNNTLENTICLGAHSQPTASGEMNIGTPRAVTSGYKGSAYRLLSGLYDGQSAHDAATKGQLDTAIINGGTTAPTTSTVGAVGTLYSYVDSGTNTPHLYSCTDTTGGTYTWTQLV